MDPRDFYRCLKHNGDDIRISVKEKYAKVICSASLELAEPVKFFPPIFFAKTLIHHVKMLMGP